MHLQKVAEILYLCKREIMVNLQAEKLQLIEWLVQLQDIEVIQQISNSIF